MFNTNTTSHFFLKIRLLLFVFLIQREKCFVLVFKLRFRGKLLTEENLIQFTVTFWAQQFNLNCDFNDDYTNLFSFIFS